MKKNIRFIVEICIIGIIIFMINQYLFQICIVQGDSMYPTLKQGSIIFIKKFYLKFDYNDIVLIKKDDKFIIKRIVGLPKDSIKIENYLYVNGKKKDDLYIKEAGNAKNELILRENEYFILGDNVNNSIDSRFEEIGIIKRNEIIGKMIK